MELRHRQTILFAFFLAGALHAQSGPTNTTYVEATPVDVFTDRSGLWPSRSVTSQRSYSDNLSPYEGLYRIPGIQSRFEGSPTISIRGSQSLPRVLGMYNGIPINGADGFGATRLLLPQEAVGETRIFKGPASVFYGADALGGAIHFLPRRYSGPTLRGHTGSFGQRGLFGALPFAKGENSYHHLTSFSEGYDGNYPYTHSSSGKGSVRSSSNRALQRHSFFGEQTLGRFRLSENLLWAQEIGSTPGPTTQPSATQARLSSGLGSFSSSYRASSDLEISHRIYGIKTMNEFRDSFGESFANSSTVGNSMSVRNRWSSVLLTEVFADHKYDDFIDTYSGRQYYTTNDSELGTTIDFALGENFILKPGSRYLFTYKKFVNAIGLFEENQNLKKWATYSEGFHAPSLIQRHSSNQGSLANPELTPESSAQIEIGFQQTHTLDQAWNKAIFELSIFSIQYKDFISTRRLNTTTSQPYNSGSASSYGVEAQAQLEYEIWKLRGTYAYLKTEDNTKSPLPLSPENQYQVAGAMRWSFLNFELVHSIWDKFYDRIGSTLYTLNSWHATDFNLSTIDLSDWTIEASILNLFDQPIELGYGYPEPQRRYLLSVERVF